MLPSPRRKAKVITACCHVWLCCCSVLLLGHHCALSLLSGHSHPMSWLHHCPVVLSCVSVKWVGRRWGGGYLLWCPRITNNKSWTSSFTVWLPHCCWWHGTWILCQEKEWERRMCWLTWYGQQWHHRLSLSDDAASLLSHHISYVDNCCGWRRKLGIVDHVQIGHWHLLTFYLCKTRTQQDLVRSV